VWDQGPQRARAETGGARRGAAQDLGRLHGEADRRPLRRRRADQRRRRSSLHPDPVVEERGARSRPLGRPLELSEARSALRRREATSQGGRLVRPLCGRLELRGRCRLRVTYKSSQAGRGSGQLVSSLRGCVCSQPLTSSNVFDPRKFTNGPSKPCVIPLPAMFENVVFVMKASAGGAVKLTAPSWVPLAITVSLQVFSPQLQS